MYIKDTIAAISTPLGEGGIGVVRISGSDARIITENIFRKNRNGGWISHRFYYGEVYDTDPGNSIDDALVVWMKAPNSFTREDVVEIQCHGGFLIVQRILDLVLRQGARLADPGEFTRRAFLNGRIDLLQAEAIIDAIRSKTDASLALAQRQREGKLSKRIGEVRQGLLHALALIEAFIDFPEEDLDDASLTEIEQTTGDAFSRVASMLSEFDEGLVVREGVSVVIAGKPNVGKSSLLNTLLREKRAIVTSVPGTTRDIIEEVVNIQGLPVKLLDTAGIRSSLDEVERIGIDLALEKIPHADMVLFVLDSSRPFDADDQLILDQIEGNRYIIVRNKVDLPQMLVLPDAMSGQRSVCISITSGAGIDDLRYAISSSFLHGESVDNREFVAISHSRHRDVLRKSATSLERFRTNFSSAQPLELLAADLRLALEAIGEITGETTPDDVLDLIFSRFCIGK